MIYSNTPHIFGAVLLEINRAEFAKKVGDNSARPRRQQRPMLQCLGLVTRAQKDTELLRDSTNVMTWQGFWNRFSEVDDSASALYGQMGSSVKHGVGVWNTQNDENL